MDSLKKEGKNMKKILKRIAVCFLACCTCFAFVGCGGNNNNTPGSDDDKTPTKTETEQFTELKTAIAKVDGVDDFNDSWTFVDTFSVTANCDVDSITFKGNIDATTQAGIKAMYASMFNTTMVEKSITSFDKSTNLGYKATYSSGSLLALNNDELSEFELVEKDEDNYIVYRYSHNFEDESYNTYEAYSADANYLKNYLPEILDELEDLVEFFDCETLEDFKASMVEFAKEEGDVVSEIGDIVPTISMKYSEKDGVSTVDVEIKYENVTLEVYDGVETQGLNVKADVVIDYDSTGILGVSVGVNISGEMEMPLAEIGEDVSMSLTFTTGIVQSYEIKKSYDAESRPAFDNDKIQKNLFELSDNVETEVQFYVNGMPYMKVSVPYGLEIDSEEIQGQFEHLKYSLKDEESEDEDEIEIEWYVDAECTQKFTGTIPSNHISLYTKVTIPETKAIVVRVYTDDFADVETNIGNILKNETIQIVNKSYELEEEDYISAIYVNGEEKTKGTSVTLLGDGKVNVIVYVYDQNDGE